MQHFGVGREKREAVGPIRQALGARAVGGEARNIALRGGLKLENYF